MTSVVSEKKTKKGGSKHRAWCFTIYEGSACHISCAPDVKMPTFGSLQHADLLFSGCLKNTQVKSMVVGLETCPETKRLHYQGYFHVAYAIPLSVVQQWICCPTAHCEAAKGSPAQNKDYCTKEGQPLVLLGDFAEKSQGSRSDVLAVVAAVEAGATMKELAFQHPQMIIKYPSGIRTLHGLRSVGRDSMTKLHIYWGDTHTGKSYTARRIHNAGAIKLLNGFWHGVDNSAGPVCIEEFSWVDYPITTMLELIDAYPVDLNVKNGTVSFRASDVYLTSNVDPEEWYVTAKNEHREAWKRRITTSRHFTEKYVPPLVVDLSDSPSSILTRSDALLTAPLDSENKTQISPYVGRDDEFEVEDITDEEGSGSPSPPSEWNSPDVLESNHRRGVKRCLFPEEHQSDSGSDYE